MVLGAAVKLNSHVLTRDTGDTPQLMIETITIGKNAIIGGYSLLAAGTTIADGEVARAFLVSAPFSTWKSGKRVRQESLSKRAK